MDGLRRVQADLPFHWDTEGKVCCLARREYTDCGWSGETGGEEKQAMGDNKAINIKIKQQIMTFLCRINVFVFNCLPAFPGCGARDGRRNGD